MFYTYDIFQILHCNLNRILKLQNIANY